MKPTLSAVENLPIPDGEEASPEARERIIQAAFRLFGRQGYARTSVQEIAEAGGVKKPVLYYYFTNKEGLYRALVDQSSQLFHRFLSEAMAAASAAGTVEERLSRLAETILGLARENKDPCRFFFAHFLAADSDRPICDDTAFEHTPPQIMLRLAREGIERGELSGDPADLERLIAGAIQLSIIKHLRHPQEEPLAPGLGRRIVRAALKGFAARPL